MRVGHVARIGNMIDANIFVRKSEGGRPLWMCRRRLEDNIKVDLTGK
jgi:hypothetical protein